MPRFGVQTLVTTRFQPFRPLLGASNRYCHSVQTKPPTYQLVIAWIIAAYFVSTSVHALLSLTSSASTVDRVMPMFWPLLTVGFCSWQTAMWRVSRTNRHRTTSDAA